jgi:hypothetical protein
MKKNKMRLTLWVMAKLGLIWRLNTYFKKNYNEVDSTKTMMDEMMVSRRTSPLLLQEIFFMMQNVTIHFRNYYTKSWNSARNEATKLTYNQTNVA